MVKNLPDKSSFWVTKHSCISQEYSHPESRLHFKESLEAKKPGNNVQIHWIQVEVIRSLPGNVLKRICHDYLSFLPFLCPECGQDGWRQISHLWLYSDLGMEETHGGAWVPNTTETSQPWIIFFLGHKSKCISCLTECYLTNHTPNIILPELPKGKSWHIWKKIEAGIKHRHVHYLTPWKILSQSWSLLWLEIWRGKSVCLWSIWIIQKFQSLLISRQN